MAEINIIGAGISGLAAAVRVSSQNPETKIHIYEASGKAGGRLKPLTVNEWQRQIVNPHLISAANNASLSYLKTVGADIAKNKVSWRTTSFSPLPLYRLFTESVQNVPYVNADKKQAFRLLLKAIAHGTIFYYAKPEDFIDKAITFIKERNATIHLNSMVTSVKEFPEHVPLIVCVDAYNLKKLGLLTGEIKPLSIVNVHFNCPRQKKETVLCPNFSFPCVLFADEETVSITISAAAKLMTYKNGSIIRIFGNLLRSIYDDVTDIPEAKIFRNHRATVKVDFRQHLIPNNVIIGGDFMNDNLPATIESSVIAGIRAADTALSLL